MFLKAHISNIKFIFSDLCKKSGAFAAILYFLLFFSNYAFAHTVPDSLNIRQDSVYSSGTIYIVEGTVTTFNKIKGVHIVNIKPSTEKDVNSLAKTSEPKKITENSKKKKHNALRKFKQLKQFKYTKTDQQFEVLKLRHAAASVKDPNNFISTFPGYNLWKIHYSTQEGICTYQNPEISPKYEFHIFSRPPPQKNLL